MKFSRITHLWWIIRRRSKNFWFYGGNWEWWCRNSATVHSSGCVSKRINNQINKWHERALRLVYNDESSSFRELLERDKSVTILEGNIQVLLIEIFKVNSVTAPETTEIFKFKDHMVWEGMIANRGELLYHVNMVVKQFRI